jgi:hypothetical protein
MSSSAFSFSRAFDRSRGNLLAVELQKGFHRGGEHCRFIEPQKGRVRRGRDLAEFQI